MDIQPQDQPGIENALKDITTHECRQVHFTALLKSYSDFLSQVHEVQSPDAAALLKSCFLRGRCQYNSKTMAKDFDLTDKQVAEGIRVLSDLGYVSPHTDPASAKFYFCSRSLFRALFYQWWELSHSPNTAQTPDSGCDPV